MRGKIVYFQSSGPYIFTLDRIFYGWPNFINVDRNFRWSQFQNMKFLFFGYLRLQDVLELGELENLEWSLNKLECSQLVVNTTIFIVNKFRMSQHLPILGSRYLRSVKPLGSHTLLITHRNSSKSIKTPLHELFQWHNNIEAYFWRHKHFSYYRFYSKKILTWTLHLTTLEFYACRILSDSEKLQSATACGNIIRLKENVLRV